MSASEDEIRELYRRIIDGWNRASAADFAASFADDGEVVGFDGSQLAGRDAIAEEMGRIFADHATGACVGAVSSASATSPSSSPRICGRPGAPRRGVCRSEELWVP
jgi:uncharacterized protein (TIGR02246 family)